MRLVRPLLLLAASLACGGDGAGTTTPEVTPSGRVVTTIVVSGPPASLSIGATFALGAEVRDQNGVAIAGKVLDWATSNSAVASVSSAGVVSAVATGSATISASVDGKSGSAQITVASATVGSVSILAPVDPVVAGRMIQLVPVVSDRNGNTLTGRRVTWTSSNPVVATVDADGRLSASIPGATTVTARSEGIAGALTIVVSAAAGVAAPTITSISPATLVPGGAVTITGTGFVAGSANAVTISGVPVAASASSETRLSLVLPLAGLPCQTPQEVPVTVATPGGSVTQNHRLAVPATRTLPVGGSFIANATSNLACNELPAGGTYLVSVFNGGSSPSSTVRFELRGSAGGGAAAQVPANDVSPASRVVAPFGTGRGTAGATAGRSGNRRAHLERLDADHALLQRLGAPRRGRVDGGASFSRVRARPPVPLTVGANTTVNYHFNSCSAAGISAVSARVVHVGPNVVVLEDNASPLAGSIDVDLLALAREFESVSYPLLRNFGNPLAQDAETDANGRVVILFTPKVNEQGQNNILGFVSGCDLYPPTQDPSVAASNQAEIIYARTVTDTSPTSTELSGRAEWRRQMPATLIHEAKHIVSYVERLSRGAGQFEAVWLEEATAQLASELYGRVIHGNGWRGDAGYARTLACESRPTTPECGGGIVAMGNHFGFLSDYLENIELKSVLSGAEDSDIYGSSWMFVRWVVDTYGGGDEGAFIRSLVQSSRSGTANIESASGKAFPELFAQFSLMLAADNLPGIGAPFIEPSWNLPDVFAGYAELGSRPPAPLAMRQSAGGAFSISGRNLRGGGAILLRLGPSTGASQLLDLRATATAALSPTTPIGLSVLRIE